MGKQFLNGADFSYAKFKNGIDFTNVTTFKGLGIFANAIFDNNSDFSFSSFNNDMVFSNCIFNGDTKFNNTVFKEKVVFVLSKFYGKTRYYSTIFNGFADFRNVNFYNEIDFEAVSFNEKVDYRYATLRDKCILKFDGEESDSRVFQKVVDFSDVLVIPGCLITFKNLTLEKCKFIKTNVSNINFINVIWPIRFPLLFQLLFEFEFIKRWFYKRERFSNYSVYDSLLIEKNWIPDEDTLERDSFEKDNLKKKKDKKERSDYQIIAKLYRQLQKNYIENLEYSTAGKFYIGEQIILMKSLSKINPRRWISSLYRTISNYGESYFRPLIWLGSVIITFPAFFMFGGVFKDRINYEWSFNPFNLFNNDYNEVFWYNLKLMVFSRAGLDNFITEDYQIGLVVLELILIITLVTLFLLALRRQFKRKSF